MAQYWDPLRKIHVEATPEEKVRQWFIGLLGERYGVPESLMNSEVALLFGQKRWRCDIAVFDRNSSPLLIVECKRPDVPLTESVARQALRYSAVLSVRFIALTNGPATLFFERGVDGVFRPVPDLPQYPF